MKVFRLGKQGNFRSMTIFHALARSGIEGLVLVEPDHCFVCLGYFDDTKAMVNLEFCTARGLPIMRRELGGGVVLLGPGQLFYQLIIKRTNPRMPLSVMEAYRKFSSAPIAAYRRLGIQTFYRPINDLVTTSGRKISGQGAADIGACFVFVGNILLDFNPDLMSRCLKLAGETFREKVCQSMEENLSWVGKELGSLPNRSEVEDIVKEEFEEILGPLDDSEVPPSVWEEADRLAHHFTSEKVLMMETSRRHSTIKVKEGTHLRQGLCKSEAGLIRAEVKIEEGKIGNLSISGDLVSFPQGKIALLSDALEGVAFRFNPVKDKVTEFFKNHLIRCAGIHPEDFALAIVGDKDGPS